MSNDIRWRKWPEEKPEPYAHCLVRSESETIDRCWLEEGGEWIYYNYCCGYDSNYNFHEKVTHWLPLSALLVPESMT